jgi:hypothetical protein
LPFLAALLLASLAVPACRREEAKPPAPTPAAAPAGTFRMKDLSAATAFDARIAKLSLLAATYQGWLMIEPGDLAARTDALAPQLEAAVAEVSSAFAAIRHPEDRARASRLAEAASRWPRLLAEARREVLAKDPAPTAAAEALAAADEEVGRALLAYRQFRSQWVLSDAPPEVPAVVGWLEARRDLERIEGALGERMPADGGVSLARPEEFRKAVEDAVARARAGASALDEPRRAQALAWIEAQERAIAAMLDLAAAQTLPERSRASLAYQAQKLAVLEATAEYTRLTAGP